MDKPAIIVKDAAGLIAALGINSVTSYVWLHHVGIPAFPSYPYEKWGDEAVKQWPGFQNQVKVLPRHATTQRAHPHNQLVERMDGGQLS